MNVIHKDKLEANITTMTLYCTCGKTWGVNDMTTRTTGYWFLHYDNAPAHYALSVHKFMAYKKWQSFHTLPTHQVMCILSFPKTWDGIKDKI
jgi:hypothetical protein